MQASSDHLYIVAQTYIFGLTLIFTIIGSIVLWNTLKAQNQSNNLSNKRYIFDIKPFFSLQRDLFKWELGKPIRAAFSIKLERNVCLDFKISVTTSQFYLNNYHERSIPIIAVGQSFDIINAQYDNSLINTELELFLFFTDEEHNKYSQRLHGLLQDLRLDPPISVFSSK